MVGYHGGYFWSHTQKSSKRLHLCAGYDKKELGCTRASAVDTFNLQQVGDSAHGCVQLGANGPDIYRCWSENQWCMLS